MEIKQLLFLPFHLCEQSGEIKDQEANQVAGSSEESKSSPERKRKRRKNKSRRKKSRKKHRRYDSFSGSEDDRSH